MPGNRQNSVVLFDSLSFLFFSSVCNYFSGLSVTALSSPLESGLAAPFFFFFCRKLVVMVVRGQRGGCGVALFIKSLSSPPHFWEEKKTAHSCDQLWVEQQVQEFVLIALAGKALIWRDARSASLFALAIESSIKVMRHYYKSQNYYNLIWIWLTSHCSLAARTFPAPPAFPALLLLYK